MSSTDKVLQRRAVAIVRAEMRSYDVLAQRPKLRYERAVCDAIDDGLFAKEHGTRSCAHGRALHDVCSDCGRDEQDCKQYRVAAQFRIQDLLKLLGE